MNSASPGCIAPEDGPAQGMRGRQRSSDCLSIRGDIAIRSSRSPASLPLLGASGTNGSNPLSSSSESGANSISWILAGDRKRSPSAARRCHRRRAPHGQAFPDQHRDDAFSFAKNAVSIAAEANGWP
jgi:hypothetical protein